MTKISIHIFYAPIYMSESRLLKTCNSLLSMQLVDKIFIIGFWERGLKEKESFSKRLEVIRVKTIIKKLKLSKGAIRKAVALLSFLGYHFSAVYYCCKIKPSYISCHNLALLPLCVVIKFLTGAKLFYEPHELETERTGMSVKLKKISRIIEKFFIRFSDKTVTVCEPITSFYKSKYKLKNENILTIRNMPVNPKIGVKFHKTEKLREEFKIPEESVIYIYQGLIDKFRGIHNYLITFSKLTEKHQLVLMGYGDEEDFVKQYSKQYSNIHFKEAVPVNEIIEYTSSADVGLFVIPGNLSLSYRFALPNKFYEYAIAGLHICVSENFEYLSEIIKNQSLGSVIGKDESSLYDWITINNWKRDRLMPTPKNYDIRKTFGWQNEERRFAQIYK